MSCNDSKKSNTEDVDVNTEVTTNNETTLDNNVYIEDNKWVITKLEGDLIVDKQNNNQEIYFILDSKTNRISGNSGCNTFMGTYKLEEGNRISFLQMAATRMACPDTLEIESKVLSVFETADNYTIEDGKLSLNKAKRAPLAVFKISETTNNPIVEKYWKLKVLDGKDVVMEENQEREVYFILKNNTNQVTGFAGCNTINGEFTIEKNGVISFKNMATTLKACPDLDFNESEFLKVFELANNYTISDDILSLNVGKRAPLAVFEAVYFQ